MTCAPAYGLGTSNQRVYSQQYAVNLEKHLKNMNLRSCLKINKLQFKNPEKHLENEDKIFGRVFWRYSGFGLVNGT